MIKFYKEAATQNWVCGSKRKIAAGTCTMETNADNTYIEIKENGIEKTIAEGPVASFVNEAGVAYANFAALDAATTDFFVNATHPLEVRVAALENRQNLFIDHWTIASADVLGNKRNNNGVIEEYDGSAWVAVAIVDGDIWFDINDNTLSVYNNSVWTLIPLSSNSVYINRADNISYVWTDSSMTSSSIEIVNDLTTGGATKALSAEQGKVLQNAKMNRLTNVNGVIDMNAIMTLVGLGFDLTGANLIGVNLPNAYLPYANLSNANLSYANFEGVNLPNANLSNANLSYMNLTNAYLEGADFTSANLIGVNLTNAYLSGANFEGADLPDASFFYTYLPNANLSYASLPNANLPYASLSNANLSYANLSYASLSNANFEGVYLTGANLIGVGLYDTKFSSANFSSATGLNANINIALTDVKKDPNGDGSIWTLTWTDSLIYSCDPSTGLFTLAS